MSSHRWVPVERTHKTLVAGAASIRRRDWADKAPTTDRLDAIWDLLDTEHSFWTCCSGDLALLSGSDDARARTVLVDEYEHRLSTVDNVFSVEKQSADPVHMRVLSVPMSARWAGITFIHELSHVYDLLTGVEQPNATGEEYWRGEARAYHLEWQILDRLTAGRFSKALAVEARLLMRTAQSNQAAEPWETISDRIEHAAFRNRFKGPLGIGESQLRLAATLSIFYFSRTASSDMPVLDAENAWLSIAEAAREIQRTN